MRKYTKSGAKKQAILQDRSKLEEALLQAKYAASTQKVYLRAFDTFAACLDQKVPATATLKEAKRHLKELNTRDRETASFKTQRLALSLFAFICVHSRLTSESVAPRRCNSIWKS